MRQRHERLASARPAQPDIILYDSVAAAKAMLVAQTFKDPFGAVPLLHRRNAIRCQDRVNHWQQRPQLRLRHRLGPRVAGRQRKPAHLRYRLAAQSKDLRGLALAVTFNKNKVPVVRIDDALEKYKTLPVFQEKVDKANEMLKNAGMPKIRKQAS